MSDVRQDLTQALEAVFFDTALGCVGHSLRLSLRLSLTPHFAGNLVK